MANRATAQPIPLIACLLFFVPTIFWTGLFGSRMNLGGDASLLYFEYPWEWLTHTSLVPLANNLGGYNSHADSIPFLAVLTLLRLLGINAQGVVFGAVLAFGFAGTARLTLTLLARDDAPALAAAVLAGSLAIGAPILATIQWTAILPRVMWIALLPWLVVLVLRHQRTGGWLLPVLTGLVLALTAPAVMDAPGSLAAAVAAVGLLAAAAIGGAVRLRLRRLGGFVVVVVLLNVFWLAPFVVGFKLHSVATTGPLSLATRESSLAAVRTLATESSVTDALGLRASTRMAVANGWAQLPVMNWSRGLWPIGALPAMLVMVSIVVLGAGKSSVSGRRILLGASMIGLTITLLFLLTAQVVPHGVDLTAFLVERVPGWIAERNFWSTWAPSFVTAAATTFGLWGELLYRRFGDGHRAMLVVTVVAMGALIFYDAPFFAGASFRTPYGGGVRNTRVMDGLPLSYRRVLDRLSTLPPGGVLSLPLNDPAWTRIPSMEGNPKGGAYIGISPIFYLTGRSDYDGIASFGVDSIPGLVEAVRSDVTHDDMMPLLRTAAYAGVRYVVVNEAALSYPTELSLSAVPPEQTITETQQLMTHASQIIFRSGPYSVRRLDPSLVPPLVAVVPRVDASLQPDYLARLAYGLDQPDVSPPCGGSVTIRSWSATRVQVAAVDVPQGCVVRLLIPHADGWEASFRSQQATGEEPVSTASPNAANAGSIAFRIPSQLGGSALIDATYVPVVALPASAGVSAMALAAGLAHMLAGVLGSPLDIVRRWPAIQRKAPR